MGNKTLRHIDILLFEDQLQWLKDNRIVRSVKIRELVGEFIKERSSSSKVKESMESKDM